VKRFRVDARLNGKVIKSAPAATLAEIETLALRFAATYPQAVLTYTDLVRKLTRPVDTNPVLL
jgi:hypothetical protein